MKPLKQPTQQTVLQVNKHICVEFMKAYQEQKVDKMISFCDPESTICFKPLGGNGKGKIHELGKGIWSTLVEYFPDIDNTVHSLVAEDGKIKCAVSIRGTQSHDLAGIISKGGSFDSEHIFVFELDAGNKIKHLDIDWDHTDLRSSYLNRISD